jgi:hypothetical protein
MISSGVRTSGVLIRFAPPSCRAYCSESGSERRLTRTIALLPNIHSGCVSSTFQFHQGGGALADLLELYFKATKLLRA